TFIFLNTSQPGTTTSFSAPFALTPSAVPPQGTPGVTTYFGNADIAAEDIDGDGRPDLVALYPTAEVPFQPSISLWRNTTPTGATVPSFTETVIPTDFTLSIAVSDMNGDGKPDLVVFQTTPHGLPVFPERWFGVFVNTTPAGGAPSFAPIQKFFDVA